MAELLVSAHLRLCRDQLTLVRRAPLALQLLLELGEEAPVGALGDEPLRAAREHPDLVQAQGVEAQGVLGAILPPLPIGDLLHDLEGIVIAPGIGVVDHELGRLLRGTMPLVVQPLERLAKADR